MTSEEQSRSMEDSIRRLAADFRMKMQETYGVEPGYDRSGVEFLYWYIERMRDFVASREGMADGMANMLGAFLGECLIAANVGRWAQGRGGEWGVEFQDGSWAFPVTKTHKQ